MEIPWACSCVTYVHNSVLSSRAAASSAGIASGRWGQALVLAPAKSAGRLRVCTGAAQLRLGPRSLIKEVRSYLTTLDISYAAGRLGGQRMLWGCCEKLQEKGRE